MPLPTPSDHHRLTAALHLYSLARRPVPDHLVRPDGLRFLVRHEVTDHWEAVANLRRVRAFLGLTRASQKTMGVRTYSAALAEALDGYDAADLDTKRGPQDNRVRLVQVVAVAQDHEDLWLDVFRDLDAPDDLASIDALAVESGLDITTPLPAEYVSTVVPVLPDVPDVDPTAPLVCRAAHGCGRTLPAESFRVIREAHRPPRPARECLDCESARLARRKIDKPTDAATYSREQRGRYTEATLAREESRPNASHEPSKPSDAYPAAKRCDACRLTLPDPGSHFPVERARPDGLSRVCKKCLAKATDRRRHPTTTP